MDFGQKCSLGVLELVWGVVNLTIFSFWGFADFWLGFWDFLGVECACELGLLSPRQDFGTFGPFSCLVDTWGPGHLSLLHLGFLGGLGL